MLASLLDDAAVVAATRERIVVVLAAQARESKALEVWRLQERSLHSAGECTHVMPGAWNESVQGEGPWSGFVLALVLLLACIHV